MNLTCNPPNVKALIDTTILCGAIRKDGLCRKLLRAARASVYFTPVLSQVCLFEFYRHAAQGLAGVTYTQYDVDDFLEAFVYPLTDDGSTTINPVISRQDIRLALNEHKPIGEFLVHLSGCTTEQAETMITQAGMQEPLRKYDQQDCHVWVASIQGNCDYIVTSNSHRFPSEIGKIKRIHPVEFVQLLDID